MHAKSSRTEFKGIEELAKLTTIKITIRIAALIGIILIIGLFL